MAIAAVYSICVEQVNLRLVIQIGVQKVMMPYYRLAISFLHKKMVFHQLGVIVIVMVFTIFVKQHL